MSKTYHFIGIEGSGMSVLALILHQMEHKVQGNDVSKHYFTQRGSRQAGVKILSSSENNTTSDAELIAGNAFYEDNNVEIVHAANNDLEFKRYHEFLGDFVRQFTSFDVAGAHGETSTTGLLPHVLKNIIDTFYLISDGTGRGSASNNYSVFESDEYQHHFAPYHPEHPVITNIDFNHPDYSESIDDALGALNDYAKQIQKALFLYGDDAYPRKITLDAGIYHYRFKDIDDFATYDIVRITNGSASRVKYDDEEFGSFHPPAFGRHNTLNATAAVANLYIASIDMESVTKRTRTFTGVKRRPTKKATNNTTIIDDFAHYLTEIIVTLSAARQKYPGKEAVAIFQLHTFTHTTTPSDELADTLNQADPVYLTPIYGSAREIDRGDVRVGDLASKIQGSAEVISPENAPLLLDHDNAAYIFVGADDIQMHEHSSEELLANSASNTQ